MELILVIVTACILVVSVIAVRRRPDVPAAPEPPAPDRPSAPPVRDAEPPPATSTVPPPADPLVSAGVILPPPPDDDCPTQPKLRLVYDSGLPVDLRDRRRPKTPRTKQKW
jgi:hypothetical protein